MNINHLKLFVKVAKTNNLSSAGRELGLSPAVASTHIAKLEKSLGVQLLERTTRFACLTKQGEVLLHHANQILDVVTDAYTAVSGLDYAPRGLLRVTVPVSFGRMHLVPFIDDFLEKYSDLSIELNLSDDFPNFDENYFDIAINIGETKEFNQSKLIYRKLADVTNIISASPDYIDKYGKPNIPESLEQHNCLNKSGVTSWAFENASKQLVVNTSGSFSNNNEEVLRDSAVQGKGVTLTPQWCSYKELGAGALIPLLQEHQLSNNQAIWAVYPSSQLIEPKARLLIDFLIERYSINPPWDK